jgi:multisubunit Na+/H+ antiporter MnhG subunit
MKRYRDPLFAQEKKRHGTLAFVLLLLIIFMWLTSPTSTHFLSMVEMNTNPYLDRYVRRREKT